MPPTDRAALAQQLRSWVLATDVCVELAQDLNAGASALEQSCETCGFVIAGFREGVRYDKCANWSEPCADIRFCGRWTPKEGV